MSAPRRQRLGGHLGRLTSADGRERGAAARRGLRRRASGPARGGRLLLAALRGELARRLYRLAVVAVALGAVVVLLYEHGDSPAGLARTVQAAPAAGPAQAARRSEAGAHAGAAAGAAKASAGAAAGPGAGAGPGAPGRSEPSTASGSGGPGAAAASSGQAQPAAVAAAWYAGRNHLKAGQVRPLQQDKLSNREVRVLVFADRGNGRLETALVTVRRDAHGRWSVP